VSVGLEEVCAIN